MKNKIILGVGGTIVALTAMLFSGCGSDGASAVADTVDGVVSGSFYEGATVCYDENGNGQCEATEEHTTSASDGSFSLSSPATAPIIAIIDTNATKHERVGDNGTQVSSPVVFAIPKEAITQAKTQANGKVVVSAISTRLYAYVKEHNTTDINTAMQNVAKAIGVNEDDLLKNFNDSSVLPAKRRELQEKADAILQNIQGDTNLTAITTRANSVVGSMKLPERIDIIKSN